jgi:hypothetical protein
MLSTFTIIEKVLVNAADIPVQLLSKGCINFIWIHPIVINCIEIETKYACTTLTFYNSVLNVSVHQNYHQAPLLQMFKNMCLQYEIFPVMDPWKYTH